MDVHVVCKFYRHIRLTKTYGAKFENVWDGDVQMDKVIYRIASLQKKRECALVLYVSFATFVL